MIFNLDLKTHDLIYDCLIESRKARGALILTCRFFRAIHSANEKFIRLAQLVSANAYWFTNTPQYLPMWQQLKLAQIIFQGENHLNDNDRIFFGQIAHLIWGTFPWIILAEGGIKHMPGKGQVKYIPKEMVETHESWEKEGIAIQAYAQVQQCWNNVLYLTSLFLIARDEKNKNSLVSLSEKLLTEVTKYIRIDTSVQLELQVAFAWMNEYLENCKDDQEDEAANEASAFHQFASNYFLKTGCIILQLYNYYNEQIEGLLVAISPIRDAQMAEIVPEKVNIGNKVLGIAGVFHLVANDGQPQPLFKQSTIPYFCFIRPESNPFASASTQPQGICPKIRESLKGFNSLNLTEALEKDEEFMRRYYVHVDSILKREVELCLIELQPPASEASPMVISA